MTRDPDVNFEWNDNFNPPVNMKVRTAKFTTSVHPLSELTRAQHF